MWEEYGPETRREERWEVVGERSLPRVGLPVKYNPLRSVHSFGLGP